MTLWLVGILAVATALTCTGEIGQAQQPEAGLTFTGTTPASLHHYDGARDEEVIVQIIGMGPVVTTDTEKK